MTVTDSKPFSVLLVDDDELAAAAVVRGLHDHGLRCPIVLAEDGAVALQILRGEHERKIDKPYVVLLDMHMPRMGGLEFLHEVRCDHALAGTVVFVLSSAAEQADRDRAFARHIAGYILKSAVGPRCSALAALLEAYRSMVAAC